MNRIKNSLVALGGVSLLIGVIALVTPRPTQGQGGDAVGPTKPVLVVNTPAEPVPVTGSITGDVNVTNTPDVNVANTVRVSDVRRQPFNETFQLFFEEGQNLGSATFTVPPGKQLVVTFFTADALLPGGQTARFFVRAGDTGVNAVLHRLSVGSDFIVSEPLHLYLDAGEILTPFVRRSDTTGPANANVSFSGYLVDVP